VEQAQLCTAGHGRRLPLLAGALVLLCCGAARGQETVAAPDAAPVHWPLPLLRTGGELGYGARRDEMPGQERIQKDVSLTLKLLANTYFWEPWLVRADGNLNLTMSKNVNDSYEIDAANHTRAHGLGMSGAVRVNVLERSQFPLELHADRSDSRATAELGQVRGTVGEHVGFRQRYMREGGDFAIGWDRGMQRSELQGSDRQDRFQLALAQAFGAHRVQLNGDATHSVHENSGEGAALKNVTLQHNYMAGPELALDNMANLSRLNYRLLQGSSSTNLKQMSSLALWRPEERDLTVTASMRLLGLAYDSTDATGLGLGGMRSRSGNLNLGASYGLTPEARVYGSANANLGRTNDSRSSNTSETVGASYTPATAEVGLWRYGWAASAAATDSHGGPQSGRQFTTQLSHRIGRSWQLDSGAGVGMDANQGMNATKGGPVNGVAGTGLARQLTHAAALWWNPTANPSQGMVRLSASDARTIDGRHEFFQMLNLQLSSSLASGRYSSWSGSLTLQSVRQGARVEDPALAAFAPPKGFVSTSGGSVMYSHTRLFSVRNLRFSSDLRLNNLSLLPVPGTLQEHETEAWENRLDYYIGRVRLRVGTLVGRSAGVAGVGTPYGPAASTPGRVNRSIMFSLSRGFGEF
jgi:hypothetical protein